MPYAPAPCDPPTTRVTLGTRAAASACTMSAPSFAIPPRSASRPTMNPATFWMKSRGVPRWAHSCMKWAPLRAAGDTSGPAFASTPTGTPCTAPNPVTRVDP